MTAKQIVVAVVLLAAAAVGIYLLIARRRASNHGNTGESPAQALRMRLLQGKPGELGISEFIGPRQVWGTLMEWRLDGVAVTLVALSDGTASLYFETGGGIIGGGGHESVRQAVHAMMEKAGQLVGQSKPTTLFPLPKPGEVTFYWLTKDGISSVSVSENELLQGGHPLSPLFFAGNEAVTQLRVATQQRKAEGPVSFKMPISDVFYIKNLDRVIVTGVVTEGSAKVGDQLIVRTGSGDIPVTLEKVERFRETATVAMKGENVGLMLTGIRKEQVGTADVVFGK